MFRGRSSQAPARTGYPPLCRLRGADIGPNAGHTLHMAAPTEEPSATPTLTKGQRVSVTWGKRGLLGKPLVYEVK